MKILFVSFSVLVCLAIAATLRAQDPVDPPDPLNPLLDPLAAPRPPALAPQTFSEKLQDYKVVTFGPRAVFSPSFSVIRRLLYPLHGYPDTWREGTGGMARYYGNAFASRTSLETGRYLSGALLHEDFRYRPSTSTNPLQRSLHALAFTFVDKSDSGHNRFAAANFIGAGAGGLVGMGYLPPGFNNFSHAETRMATAFAGFAAENLLHEFNPELVKLKHKLHLPFTTSPLPKWWTRRN